MRQSRPPSAQQGYGRPPAQQGRQAPPAAQQQAYGRPPPTRSVGTPDFLSKLEKAEERDSQRGDQDINVYNWEQRSKAVGQLALRNEAAEIAAKQRLGLLPTSEAAPQPPTGAMQQPPGRGMQQQQMRMQQMQQQQPRGFSAATQQPPGNIREAMTVQRQMQQQQQQQQLMQRKSPQQMSQQQMMQQQMMQQPVKLGGSFDPWDERVPRQLQSGGQSMTAQTLVLKPNSHPRPHPRLHPRPSLLTLHPHPHPRPHP